MVILYILLSLFAIYLMGTIGFMLNKRMVSGWKEIITVPLLFPLIMYMRYFGQFRVRDLRKK